MVQKYQPVPHKVLQIIKFIHTLVNKFTIPLFLSTPISDSTYTHKIKNSFYIFHKIDT